MKFFPYVFIVLSTCLYNTTIAQVTIPKGTNSLSGNIAYYSNHSNNEDNSNPYSSHFQSTNNTGSMGVSMGYFIKDNLSFNYGLFGNLWNNHYQNESSDINGNIYTNSSETKSYSVYFGTGISKFWFIKQTSFAVELDANIRAGMGRRTREYASNQTTTTYPTTNLYSGAFFLTPKIHYFISPKWSLNASLGNINYQYTLEHSIGNDNIVNKSNQLNATFGLSSFMLGLQLYF